jgi:NAD(P)-dependent dehydrogenase (short-subunit alcohol dehydrogenase family)
MDASTVALVSGASSGIGAATARRLAREPGIELVLVARRAELLDRLAASLPARSTTLALDLTAEDAPARARDHLESRYDGRLDLLVNNAGTGGRGAFADSGQALVRRTMVLEEAAILSRFPVAFRLPAFASRSSDARRGIGPSSRSAYRTRPPARTPTGLPRSARMSCDRDGSPLYPGDDGAHPAKSSP